LLFSNRPGFFKAFLPQVTGVTEWGDFLQSAFWAYGKGALMVVAPVTAAVAFLRMRAPKQWGRPLVAAILLVGLAGAVAVPVLTSLRDGAYTAPVQGTYHALLLGGLVAAAVLSGENLKAWATVAAMTAVGWAAGISWGYATPALYVLPGAFAMVFVAAQSLDFKLPNWALPTLTAVVFAANFVHQNQPYRDAARGELDHHLGDLFPRLSHIYTGSDNYAKYADFKVLHTEFGDNFTVLPAFPLANYLTHTTPPISVDWAHDAEINKAAGLAKLTQELEVRKPHVFVEKDKIQEASEGLLHYRSALLAYVLENWLQIEETEHFFVYVHPSMSDRAYIFLGHPRSNFWDIERMDEEVEKIDYSKFDKVILGGDVMPHTSANRANMQYLDSIVDLDSSRTIFTLGNHDIDSMELVQEFTKRPPFYTQSDDGITWLNLNTNDSICNMQHAQLRMIRRVCDTLKSGTHLIVLTHHLTWAIGQPDIESKLRTIINGTMEDYGPCMRGNNFYEEVYPRLLEVKKR
ncbi:MAG: metallophosphoesterase, partial [Bacteroidota bacterium]